MEMKRCIKDFIISCQEQDKKNVVYDQWNGRFAREGYYKVELTRDPINNWTRDYIWWRDVHDWCVHQFGLDHYASVGETFWFETEANAIEFILRWR